MKLGDDTRLQELVKLAVVAAFFACALGLSPHPSGLGTHRALGLPACPFPVLFGLPCATCGFTTACAELARLHLGRALAVQPLALPLCLVLTLQAAISALRLAGLAVQRDALELVWRHRSFALVSLAGTWSGRLLGMLL